MTKPVERMLHLPAIGRGCWKHDVENSEVSTKINRTECQCHLVLDVLFIMLTLYGIPHTLPAEGVNEMGKTKMRGVIVPCVLPICTFL